MVSTGLLNYDANDRTSTDSYDADGSLLSSGAGANVYDFENHLVQAGGVKLVYDGDGNRVKETVATVTTSYLVADQNLTGYAQVVDELQGGSVSRTYSYGLELINERQSVAGTATTSFYGFDGHGSVRFLTSFTGVVTDTYDYDAYGILTSQAGTTPNNYLFAGEQFDYPLGIYFMRARYYHQRVGRFWTMDSFEGDPQSRASLHKYLYAGASPTDRIDPSGNEDIATITTATSISLSIGASAYLYYQLYNLFTSQADDPAKVPLAVAVAIQRRSLGPELKRKLDEFKKDYVFFVHGTSESAAADINLFGVNKDKILAGGKGSLRPGAFSTLLLEPNPITAIELASSRKPAPHAIMVGYLPRRVFNSLKATEPPKVLTVPLVGADYDETVFFEPAFPTLDSYNLTRWGIALIP